MPWATPTLRDVRSLVRDAVNASLPGADANVPNSVLRVMSDNQGALCHLTLQYVDWLALQLLPDTAEVVWLDRHGQIWLVNADGSTGRKLATLAQGTAQFVGIIDGTVIPTYSQLQTAVQVNPAQPGNLLMFETLEDITTSAAAPVEGTIRAIQPGSIGNLPSGTTLAFTPTINGVSARAIAVDLTGGTDTETDDELRARVLQRIRNPPMGGDLQDYVAWALAVPGVTRAWAQVEQGIGTVTVRFMMDDLRADNQGFPYSEDIVAVGAYIDKMRPVAVKDCFTCAPIKQQLDLTISNLVPNTDECKAEIESSLQDMLFRMAAPGQTIYVAWINYAIMSAASVQSYYLALPDSDVVMGSLGNMAVLGTINYE
jgi:uncharacterized phage protein gp47/JayE